jgi:hypothetical protein
MMAHAAAASHGEPYAARTGQPEPCRGGGSGPAANADAEKPEPCSGGPWGPGEPTQAARTALPGQAARVPAPVGRCEASPPRAAHGPVRPKAPARRVSRGRRAPHHSAPSAGRVAPVACGPGRLDIHHCAPEHLASPPRASPVRPHRLTSMSTSASRRRIARAAAALRGAPAESCRSACRGDGDRKADKDRRIRTVR